VARHKDPFLQIAPPHEKDITMDKLFVSVLSFWNSIVSGEKEKGATATEYAVLVAFIALIIITGVGIFGNALSDWFGALAGKITGGR
jgi:pilus assembly protein Flp/PilA